MLALAALASSLTQAHVLANRPLSVLIAGIQLEITVLKGYRHSVTVHLTAVMLPLEKHPVRPL